MDVSDVPARAGVHHLKLPVTDLARSREWYHSRLRYQVQIEFVEQGQLMGYELVTVEDWVRMVTPCLRPGEIGVTADRLGQDVAGPADHEQLQQLPEEVDGHQNQHCADHDGEQRTQGTAEVRGRLDHPVLDRPGGRPDEVEAGRVGQPPCAVQRVGQGPAESFQRVPDQLEAKKISSASRL